MRENDMLARIVTLPIVDRALTRLLSRPRALQAVSLVAGALLAAMALRPLADGQAFVARDAARQTPHNEPAATVIATTHRQDDMRAEVLGRSDPMAPYLVPAPAWAGAAPTSGLLGGVGATAGEASAAATMTHDWRETPAIVLPSTPARWPAPAPQWQASDPGDGQAWLDRALNPGNWILDAGMGIFSGIVKMFSGIAQKAVQALLKTDLNVPTALPYTTNSGNQASAASSVLPQGCDNSITNFVFCTPPTLTYGHPLMQVIWNIFKGIATSIATILFIVRLGRLIIEGQRSLATEGKELVFSFMLAAVFIQATYPICKLLIDFFNSLSTLLLEKGAMALPMQDVAGLHLGLNFLSLVFWVLLLILTFKRFAGLVQIIVLLAVAPLAGALLLDRSTSARFRSWFEKLIELLFAQINLVIIFIVIAAILEPYQSQSAGDQFVGFLISIVIMGMALSGQSAIGIAAGAIGGGGGYLKSMLLAGAVGRISGGGARLAGRGAGALAQGIGRRIARSRGELDPDLIAGLKQPGGALSGDPAQSVAARRSAPGGRRASPIAAITAGLRRGFAEHGAAAPQRPVVKARADLATARDAKAVARRTGDAMLMDKAQRTQARAMGALLRADAKRLDGLARSARAQGYVEVANDLVAQHDRKTGQATKYDAITHAGAPRPPTLPSSASQTRRATHQSALAEVAGMHNLERAELQRMIASDEARAAALPEAIMRAQAKAAPDADRLHRYQHQATPERTTGHRQRRAAQWQRAAQGRREQPEHLRQTYAAASQRIAQNRERSHQLNMSEGAQHAPETYTAAAALAYERLPEHLRRPRSGEARATAQAALDRARNGMAYAASGTPADVPARKHTARPAARRATAMPPSPASVAPQKAAARPLTMRSIQPGRMSSPRRSSNARGQALPRPPRRRKP